MFDGQLKLDSQHNVEYTVKRVHQSFTQDCLSSGGDVDAASKTLIGVFADTSQPEKTKLLVAVRSFADTLSKNNIEKQFCDNSFATLTDQTSLVQIITSFLVRNTVSS